MVVPELAENVSVGLAFLHIRVVWRTRVPFAIFSSRYRVPMYVRLEGLPPIFSFVDSVLVLGATGGQRSFWQ